MAFFQTENLWVNQLADGVAALVLDLPDRKVNVLNRQVLTDLDQALDKVAAGDFHVLIIKSGKPDNFCAGADLQAFSSHPTTHEIMAVAEQGQRVFAKLAALSVPSVAIIGGSCLGGGLELALACDYRVVIDKPTTKLGLPEVELGLLPAWGGTQRLPPLVGLERAVILMMGGKRLTAYDALLWGLADEIAEGENPPAFLAQPRKCVRAGLPARTWRQWFLEKNRLGRWLLFRGIRRWLKRRVPDDMPAPWEALAAVQLGIHDGIDKGLAYERAAIGRLIETPACRNLLQLFLQREQLKKPPDKKRGDARTIRKIGLVGAGAMGSAVAHLAIMRGFEIVIKEANEMSLGLAMLRLLGMFKQPLDQGVLAQPDIAKKLANIHGTTAWKGFDNVDLVIEAIDEDRAKKTALLQDVEKYAPARAIIASLTSSLAIADLQKGLKHPGRVAGLHFFPVVAKVPLVEVVRGPATEAAAVDDLADWTRKLGRSGMVVRDSPGFLVHRICMPAWNEAVVLLTEGVPAERIDQAMIRFGMPQGPLEYLDQMGLDEAAALVRAMQPLFGERLALSPLFERMVENGWLGLKSGAGFFRYKKGRQKKHYGLQRILADLGPSAQREILSVADQLKHVRERLTALMVNEAVRCLEEGLAEKDKIDVAMVLAGAWPPHRGGPLRFAEAQGKAMAATLTELSLRFGPRFEPRPHP
jgi:3-hydroxyacyl-CoA dehydrogenase/enoyl-CoA hydratase/3-hydroxybutyryl-CoA epimerase